MAVTRNYSIPDMDNITLAGDLSMVYNQVNWIQVVTSVLSIIGSGSIIGYAVFQNACRLPEVRPLFYLSVSDLLLAFCWLVGAVLYKSDTSGVKCFNLQAMGQIFYLSTFLYTANYVWQIFSHFRRRLSHDLNQISILETWIGRIVTVLCSLVPVLLICPVFYYGNTINCYGNNSCLVLNVGSHITIDYGFHTEDGCTALHTYSTIIFMITFSLSSISILVILSYSYRLFRSIQNDSRLLEDHWTTITAARYSLLLFPLIFIFCCLPVIILIFVTMPGKNDGWLPDGYQALCYIQAFTAISQGFLNSLAYGWTQQMIRCQKQNNYRDVDTQTPLLRSQKNLYASMQTSNTSIGPLSVAAIR
ncbi:hypothetical protein GDO81_002395 [Engystomops pustulosus]|uniref:G-protein coupled receptors family 1 profile domain-containing protein n=1 Tax=Engystomops pustulosus TaxID=76066 RepID=A0AAV7DJX6_ENGPU|nr:hypothetical protein GDO81_002395 [Engystomops pustulosus]